MEFSSAELGKIVGTEVFGGKIRTLFLDIQHLSCLISIEMLSRQLTMSPEFRGEVWCGHRNLRINNILICSL